MKALDHIRVELGERSYDVVVGDGAMASAGPMLLEFAKRGVIFVIADDRAAEHHLFKLTKTLGQSRFKTHTHIVPGGERAKTFAELERALEWLISTGADRGDLVLSFGGGAVGDLAGLAAALCKRGCKVAHLPTTLLSQVDSAIGGKTAINAKAGKNMVGLFHQPVMVIADVALLDTLGERERRAGYAEILKYGVVYDREHYDWCVANVKSLLRGDTDALVEAVKRCAKAKAKVVTADEREQGERALLNLGHTFGHALEAEAEKPGAILHGEAVAAGVGAAFDYAVKREFCEPEIAEEVKAHLKEVGLPTSLGSAPGGPYAAAALLERMKKDKKNVGGSISLVLPRRIGRAFVDKSVNPDGLLAFLKENL